MTDPYTTLTCLLLALATTGYAVVLRRKEGSYAPRYTWFTVVVGVSIVLLYVGFRLLLLPLPVLPPGYSDEDLVRWAFGWALLQVLWHFMFGGAPIIVWQLTQVSEQLEQALNRALKRRTP